jgi:hypothetical protein
MAKLCTVSTELERLEAAAAVHRADFERERERCERLMAEVIKTTADLMAARHGSLANSKPPRCARDRAH